MIPLILYISTNLCRNDQFCMHLTLYVYILYIFETKIIRLQC
jgi:hypothetical protein